MHERHCNTKHTPASIHPTGTCNPAVVQPPELTHGWRVRLYKVGNGCARVHRSRLHRRTRLESSGSSSCNAQQLTGVQCRPVCPDRLTKHHQEPLFHNACGNSALEPTCRAAPSAAASGSAGKRSGSWKASATMRRHSLFWEPPPTTRSSLQPGGGGGWRVAGSGSVRRRAWDQGTLHFAVSDQSHAPATADHGIAPAPSA